MNLGIKDRELLEWAFELAMDAVELELDVSEKGKSDINKRAERELKELKDLLIKLKKQ